MLNLGLLKIYITRENIWRALKNPQDAVQVLKGISLDLTHTCSLLSVAPAEFSKYIEEVRTNKYFATNVLECLKRYESRIKKQGLTVGAISEAIGAVLYAIIRCLRPDNVLETGVANGLSSAYILLALEENRKGNLYSIDLPARRGRYIRMGISSLLPDGLQCQRARAQDG